MTIEGHEDHTPGSDAQLQGEFQLLDLETPLPFLEGRSVSFEGAKTIIDNFADGHDELLVHFEGPDDETVTFKVVAMAVRGNQLLALMRADSMAEMGRFHSLLADSAPAGLALAIDLGKDPSTGEVADPIDWARLREVRVQMAPKN